MLAFFYFVQMLINLPKMLLVSWNNMIPKSGLKITTVTQPELWMTSFHRTINLSICHVDSRGATWQIDDERVQEGRECSREFRIDPRVPHRVTVEVWRDRKEMVMEGIEAVKMFWLASVGDSFSSGQGNPGSGRHMWLDEPCYRSTLAFPYLVAQSIPNSALSFLSCSGSTVDNGVLSQLDTLQHLISSYGSPPDSLLLTIGGNDIGFSDVISMVQRDSKVDDKFDMRFFFVSHQIDRVARKLRDMKISKVILVTYYDITKNDKGEVDPSCGAFGQVSKANLQLAEKRILQRLNSLLRRKAAEHGWITVDTMEMFRTRGLCSSRSLIRTKNESLVLQGNEYGSFHPNGEAHRLISREVLRIINN
uniref:SGNH_hydro domain-containing protein n=2 Tax=Caenorhabditis tropicalis TaxID=1561998 RepID=A0A1I7UN26_9PELO